ncbi:MAG: Rieske 2Fe-2S domain-containing protein [Arenicellales bacterium]
MSPQIVELRANDRPFADLPERMLNGEIFVIRNCLQEIGQFDELVGMTYDGISDLFGNATSQRIREVGIEKIHKVLGAGDIPKLTEAIYEIAARRCFSFLRIFIDEVMMQSNRFYFERKANVRFHLPYDCISEQAQLFESYVKRLGPGKITPHSPHRDSWVNHPSNAVNVWIAAGTIKSGNSLIIFPDAYRRNLRRTGMYLNKEENPGVGVTFTMNPGDVLLFNGDHLHSSEINTTDCTRHVISFRLTFEKPNYRYGHFYRYAHSAFAGGLLDKFADVPQNIAWSYIRFRTVNPIKHHTKRIVKQLAVLVGIEIRQRARPGTYGLNIADDGASDNKTQIQGHDVLMREIKPISRSVCVARTENNQVRAFSRYCPHNGADLSLGTILNGKIMCPWHNLPIDLETGFSPCESLKKLEIYSGTINDK